MYAEYENKKLSLGLQGIHGKVVSCLSEKSLKRKLLVYCPEFNSKKLILEFKKLFESLLAETEICDFVNCCIIRKKFYRLLKEKKALSIEEDEKLSEGFYYLAGELIDFYFETVALCDYIKLNKGV